ncbi:MAG: hypothetical protein WD073_03225 [Xanthobacteraceae bacterium]
MFIAACFAVTGVNESKGCAAAQNFKHPFGKLIVTRDGCAACIGVLYSATRHWPGAGAKRDTSHNSPCAGRFFERFESEPHAILHRAADGAFLPIFERIL